MAMPGESTDEENEKDKVLEKEIEELRSVKKVVLECSRPFSDVLDKIAQRERECVDRRMHLRAEKHDRDKQKQAVQRLIEVESELKHVKSENVELKHSLDQATKNFRLKVAELESKVTIAEQKLHLTEIPTKSSLDKLETELNCLKFENQSLKQKLSELCLESTHAEERHEILNTKTVTELQENLMQTTKLLCKTKEDSNEMRRRLSVVQERLTLAEQLTAATQQRELQESDNSELLQLELTPQLQPTTPLGNG